MASPRSSQRRASMGGWSVAGSQASMLSRSSSTASPTRTGRSKARSSARLQPLRHASPSPTRSAVPTSSPPVPPSPVESPRAKRGSDKLKHVFDAARVRVPASLFYQPHSYFAAPEVDLSLWNTRVDNGVIAILATLEYHTSALRSLSLATCQRVTDVAASTLFSKLPALRQLDISHCSGLTSASLLALLGSGKSPHLRTLRMAGCAAVNAAVLKALPQGCPVLCELDVSECGGVTNEGLVPVLLRCEKLEVLEINGCHAVSDTCLVQLSRRCGILPPASHALKAQPAAGIPTPLRRIGFKGCAGITTTTVEHVLVACKRLQHLDLTHCGHAVSDAALRTAMDRKVVWGRAPKLDSDLAWLSLAGCSRVTDVGVTW